MANILEFLRGVLTEAGAQRAFRTDPAGYLEGNGFADLTGEDVAQAVVALRRSLPDEVAGALAAFDDGADLAVRPAAGESELDAAIRLLAFAADQAPSVDGPGATSGEPEGKQSSDHGRSEEQAEQQAQQHPEQQPAAQAEQQAEQQPAAQVEQQAEQQRTAEQSLGAPEPQVSAVADPAPPGGGGATDADRPAASGVAFDLGTLPSVSAFAELLTSTQVAARQRHDAVVAAFEEATVGHAQAFHDRCAELLEQVEQEVGAVRSTAEVAAAQLRADAAADAEVAGQARASAQAEADAILAAARADAESILASAHAEVDARRQEVEDRRTELRRAEEQLKERLDGIDSLFRKVLHDDDAPGLP